MAVDGADRYWPLSWGFNNRRERVRKSIYLVNPKAAPQPYFGADIHADSGFPGALLVADLALVTVAGFIPDAFDIHLCDEHVSDVDLDFPADYIALTAKSSQVGRLLDLADAFRRRGRIVIIGGPVASLDCQLVRPHCDILVRGEIEELAPRLFADLLSGDWRDEYVGDKPDLSRSPIPRWDLYPNHRAILGAVQTSRGCPFECDFCDVPTYAGRHQRRKTPAQVLAELDVLYRHGYRSVFLADDNFTASRRNAKDLLEALAAWNHSRDDGAVSFTTQLSLDAAQDDDMLRLCGEAGIGAVFIGLETINEDSLRASGKRQNLGQDMVERIGRFLDHHIMVISGMIIGFDTDGPGIFEQQRRFVQSAPIPIFTLGALIAPNGTPLFQRMTGEGRLMDQSRATLSTAMPWQTNIIPRHMSRQHLLDGVQGLGEDIYAPQAFGQRLLHMVDRLGPYRGPRLPPAKTIVPARAALMAETAAIIRALAAAGPQERAMVARVGRHVLDHRPDALPLVQSCLRFYAQIRHVYARAKATASP